MKKAKERGRLRLQSVIRSSLQTSVSLCALGSACRRKNMYSYCFGFFCLSKLQAQEMYVKVKVREVSSW